jgi:hypothetical protein
MLLAAASGAADTMYKYRDPDGNWIYSDRPPPDGATAETVPLEGGTADPVFGIRHVLDGNSIRFVAINEFQAPVEVMLRFDRLSGLEFPDPDDDLRRLVPPQFRGVVLSLDRLSEGGDWETGYVYEYVVGDPGARHRPPRPYRTPYALAASFPVSQAYPVAATHMTADSAYAVDFAVPVGTDIFAARGGVVFAVQGANYRGGLDTSRQGAKANVVQILHDDGTYAVYAHLNRASIRVKPGDRVERGQYIAESGNTGFSTGPHLHFAVLRNAGMRIESLPVVFEGPNRAPVVPATGKNMTAY